MIIYTTENNPAALKLLICANFAKKNVDLKIVNLQDPAIKEPKRLPLLQLECGNQLFLVNSACRYLFELQDDIEHKIESWLEWESCILRPILMKTFSTKCDTKETVKNVLKKLDESINNSFLCENRISVCDIVIWCTIYPLYIDITCKDYFSGLNRLEMYLLALENIPEVKKVLAKYKISSAQNSYQIMASGEKFVGQSVENSSPVHQIEAVTSEELKRAESSWFLGAKNLPSPKVVKCPVLPIKNEKNILITSALPYVNNVPHLGNIIGCVLSADVFARYCRLCNYNTVYICGTDEYGTATETKALEEGLTPQEICDKYFEIHNDIYRWFGIGFDFFGRTTTTEQTQLCQQIFLELHANGFISSQQVEQMLCEKCDKYLADRFIEGGCPHLGCGYPDARGDQCDGCSKLVNAAELINPRCKVCGNKPVVRMSQQFFLELPKLEPLLHHWIEKSSAGWSNIAQVIAKAWLKEGLKPRCITRDLKWGIPVPLDGFRDKVFYVWFDAPIGYMSITKRYTSEWEKWWKPQKDVSVTCYQFMAKDNVPFHSIMFPAVLLGVNKGYTTVNSIMATEYLNYEDGKFSKSRGIGVFGNDAQDTGIPSDVWRFYLLYVRPESQDSSFSWADLAMKNNSELLNNLGNFINRALSFTEKFFDSLIPNIKPNVEDFMLLALCNRELKNYVLSLEKCKLRDGIRYILAISRHCNQYMQTMQPWVLLKGSDDEKVRAGTVIGLCCNIVYLLSTLLHPYMPETSRIIRKQLNVTDLNVIVPEKPEIVQLLLPGHKIGKPAPLFTKIESAKVDELKIKYAGKQNQQTNNSTSFNIADLESAVAKQADKVRTLKSSGTDKKIWEPEVKILLELKKKLADAKNIKTKSNEQDKHVNSGVIDQTEVKKLEQEIEKQGLLVRNLKSSGVPKPDWQPQVNILLELKSKLAMLVGAPVTPSGGKTKNKK